MQQLYSSLTKLGKVKLINSQVLDIKLNVSKIQLRESFLLMHNALNI